jgi:L-alanine-DL-glutamate epimerase-like enolase superfamily enzyme
MTDCNQSLTLADARQRVEMLKPFNLTWIEEPFLAHDVSSHRQLCAMTNIPVAVGESIYSIHHFKEYLLHEAADIIQVDAGRIGGITPWLKVAHLAECFNKTVCPHFLMELHISLCCAIANSRWLEYIPELDEITHSGLDIVDGVARPSQTPGLGIDWNWEAINAQTLCRYII